MSLANLDRWFDDREAQKNFFIERKRWAREVAHSQGLNKPGDTLQATFAGCEFGLVIGPRGGLKIEPVCLKAFKACSRIRSGYFELPAAFAHK